MTLHSRDKLVEEVPFLPTEKLGLKELERLRLMLRGGSVIDWRRLFLDTREEVDHFLRLCALDPTDPHDEEWGRTVLAEAVEYLRRTFKYRVAEAVARPAELHDLFLIASGAKEPQRYRRIACVVLKVMHVIQHIEGRDLLFRLAVSEADVAEMLTEKVMGVAREMRLRDLPVVEFSDSIKSRESLITKLLAKKDTVAAQIYDRTRFRIVTRTRDDLLPVLYFLAQRLFPFNFVVPGQSENTLLPFRQVVEETPHFRQFADALEQDLDFEGREGTTSNVFSGSTYRALNFVVDVPLRMDPLLPPPDSDHRTRRCRIVFGQCEFQIIDEQTALSNEEGENSHERYKRRQRRQVLLRLSRGLVVPRGRPEPL